MHANFNHFLPTIDQEMEIKEEIKFMLMNDCTKDEMNLYASMEFYEQVFLMLNAVRNSTKDFS